MVQIMPSAIVMPSTDHPDSSENSGGSTSAVPSLSDECIYCDAPTSVIEAESLEQLKATDFA